MTPVACQMQSSDSESVRPVLILGLGNVLLGDDGVGPALLEMLREKYVSAPEVECIDGATQGMALLSYLTGRSTLILLDAFANGKAPGEITILNKEQILAIAANRATTAHEGNAGELIAAAHLLGELPEQVFLIGVQPENIRTELGLSAKVSAALQAACGCACEIVDHATPQLLSKPCA